MNVDNERSTAAPFINNYKRDFLIRRLIQTLIGGMIVKTDDSILPWFIYLLQVNLFVCPFLFGGIGILISDITQVNRLYIGLATGFLYMIYIICLKIIVLIVSNTNKLTALRKKTETFIKDSHTKSHTHFSKDEDQHDLHACISVSTLNFIFPYINIIKFDNGTFKTNCFKFVVQILRIIFDSIIAGFIMVFAVNFESIVYLQTIFNLGGAICIFILNWTVLCIALYALTIREPVEPAIEHIHDDYKIQHFTRAFYVILFQLVETIYNFAPSNAQIPTTAIFCLKIAFIFLPILWLIGMLPPIDTFFLWIFEQLYIFIYGGTATATRLRLMVQLCLAIFISLFYLIPSDLAILIIYSVFGYILSSIDVVYLIDFFYSRIKYHKRVFPYNNSEPNKKLSDKKQVQEQADINIPKQKQTDKAFMQGSTTNNKSTQRNYFENVISSKPKPPDFFFNWKDLLYHCMMLVATVVISTLLFTFMISFQSLQVQLILQYIGIGFFILVKILADIQSVYIFFGLIRNPFYPKKCLTKELKTKGKNVEAGVLSINQDRIFFKICKYSRLLLIKIVVPFLLLAIVSIDCNMNKIYSYSSDHSLRYWRAICVLRAYRWLWQSSFLCLFEISVTHVVIYSITFNTESENSLIQNSLMQNFLALCLLTSFLRDRFVQLAHKFYAFMLITITAWSMKKQRRRAALVFLVLNFGLLPFVIVLITIAAILSAPLMPLFTFSVYLIGFPRPKWFWYQKGNFFSSDIVSFALSQTKSIFSNQQQSSIDSSFYAQLVSSLTFSFKELLRTGSIGPLPQPDTFYLSRFQDRTIWIQIMESGNGYCIINVKGLELKETSCHTREAQQIDDHFERAFENPRGAINNNSSKCINFNPYPFNCMQPQDVLVFNGYSDARNQLVGVLDNSESFSSMAFFFPKILHYFIIMYLTKENNKLNFKSKSISKHGINIKTAPVVDLQLYHLDSNSTVEEDTLNIRLNQSKQERKNDKDELINFPIFGKQDKNITNTKKKSISSDSWTDLDSEQELNQKEKITETNMKKDDNIIYNEELFDFNKNIGDFSKKDKSLGKPNNNTGNNNDKLNKPLAQQTTNSNYFYSSKDGSLSQILYAMPSKWLTFLNENVASTSTSSKFVIKQLRKTITSKAWIKCILDHLQPDESFSDLLDIYESTLGSEHFAFLLKCCQALGIDEAQIATNYNNSTIFSFFNGDLPWSSISEKISSNFKDLHELFVKSFQYTVKMVIDHLTICPIENDQDFFDTLKDYEVKWFIGPESQEHFISNILTNKPFIFTLCKDPVKKTLSSRTLSLQQIRSPLAQLNSEVVKAIWAATNLELLYMTNDDDERYSIQAHLHILRNLTIQSCDSPLGYSIFHLNQIYLPLTRPF